jgi:hypothetical protein
MPAVLALIVGAAVAAAAVLGCWLLVSIAAEIRPHARRPL